jgi:hypothetical protein
MEIVILHEDRATGALAYAALRRAFHPAPIHMVRDRRALRDLDLGRVTLAVLEWDGMSWASPAGLLRNLKRLRPDCRAVAVCRADSEAEARAAGADTCIVRTASRLNPDELAALRRAP